MAKSHMERTLEVLKENDCMSDVVEKFNAFAGKKRDLFGFADILAVHPVFGVMAVQVCGGSDFAEHEKKMLGPRREAMILWLLAGVVSNPLAAQEHRIHATNRIILIGWRELKGRGWTPRIREFTLADFPEVDPHCMDVLARSVRADCPEWLRINN